MNINRPPTRVCCFEAKRSRKRSGHDVNALGCRFVLTTTRPDPSSGSCLASALRTCAALSSADGIRTTTCRFGAFGPRTAPATAIRGRRSSGESDTITVLGSPDFMVSVARSQSSSCEPGLAEEQNSLAWRTSSASSSWLTGSRQSKTSATNVLSSALSRPEIREIKLWCRALWIDSPSCVTST